MGYLKEGSSGGKHRLGSFVLYCLIICSVVFVFWGSAAHRAFADDFTPAATDWADAAQEQPAGYQEEDDRVLISDAEGFAWFAKQVNEGTTYVGKYVSLQSDIDLENRTWTPIGDGLFGFTPFSGVFDGMGHSVSHLVVSTDSSWATCSLFGVVQDGTIKNVHVDSGTITNPSGDAAGIVTAFYGDNATISSCSTGGDLSITGKNIAGIVSRAYAAENTVEDCVNNAALTSTAKVGGIVNLNNTGVSARITNCVNNAALTGQYAGGIIAYGNAGVTVSGCRNTGAVTSSSGDSSNDDAGGIVGFATGDGAWIQDCSNAGVITAKGNAGGIAGIITMSYSLTRCENTGAVVSQTASAGGIVGSDAHGSIVDCANASAVTGVQAGGVAGVLQAKGVMENCRGGADVISGSKAAGRLIATADTGGTASLTSGDDIRLSIDDESGDSYADGLAAIGSASRCSVIVESGTLNGVPGVGGASAYITFQEGADAPDIAATIALDSLARCQVVSSSANTTPGIWRLNRSFDSVETTTEATCEQDGVRTYSYGTDTIMNLTTPRKTEDALECQVALSNQQAHVLTQSAIDKFYFDIYIPDGLTLATSQVGDVQNGSSYVHLNTATTGAAQTTVVTKAPDGNLLHVSADEFYRRDGSGNIYDGTGAYDKQSLSDRLQPPTWTEARVADSTFTFTFTVQVEEDADIDALMGQLKTSISWDGAGCSIDDSGNYVTPDDSLTIDGRTSPGGLTYKDTVTYGTVTQGVSVFSNAAAGVFTQKNIDDLYFDIYIPDGLEYQGGLIMEAKAPSASQTTVATKMPEGNLLHIAAGEFYRRDGSGNIYDGTGAYAKESLADRLSGRTTTSWNDTKVKQADFTTTFLLAPTEGTKPTDELFGQVKVTMSWDGVGCSIDAAGNYLTPEKSVTVFAAQPETRKTVTVDEVIPASGHHWSAESVVKEPTCAQTGIRRSTCTSCDAMRDTPIPTNDAHLYSSDGSTFDVVETVREPVVGEVGIRSSHCSVCHATQTHYYSVLHHETNSTSTVDDVEVINTTRDTPMLLELNPLADEANRTFVGWCGDKELTQPVTEVSVLGSATVYAHWLQKEVPVDPEGPDEPDPSQPNTPESPSVGSDAASSGGGTNGSVADSYIPSTGDGVGMLVFAVVSVAIGAVLVAMSALRRSRDGR